MAETDIRSCSLICMKHRDIDKIPKDCQNLSFSHQISLDSPFEELQIPCFSGLIRHTVVSCQEVNGQSHCKKYIKEKEECVGLLFRHPLRDKDRAQKRLTLLHNFLFLVYTQFKA